MGGQLGRKARVDGFAVRTDVALDDELGRRALGRGGSVGP